MQTGYFSAAWHDITSSPGWFGKMFVLGLVSLIPIFGWIVVTGYVYGWARDMAWGVHMPLPAHVFGNEDGKLYSRGFFVCVLALVCSLIPGVVDTIVSDFTGGSFGIWPGWDHASSMAAFPYGVASGIMNLVLSVLSVAIGVFALLFSWVGAMRVSIYGRLSAGFQLGKVWSMLRYNFAGIMRIVGMAVLMGLVMTVVVSILVVSVVFICMIFAFFTTGGNMYVSNVSSNMGMMIAIGGLSVVLALFMGLILATISAFVSTMIARALGYWTQQFNVPAWRGQDDPLPFEVATVSGMQGTSNGPGQQPPTP